MYFVLFKKKNLFIFDVSIFCLEMIEGFLYYIVMILVLYCLLVNRYIVYIYKLIDINIFNINRFIEKKVILYMKYFNDKIIFNKFNLIVFFLILFELI